MFVNAANYDVTCKDSWKQLHVKPSSVIIIPTRTKQKADAPHPNKRSSPVYIDSPPDTKPTDCHYESRRRLLKTIIDVTSNRRLPYSGQTAACKNIQLHVKWSKQKIVLAPPQLRHMFFSSENLQLSLWFLRLDVV